MSIAFKRVGLTSYANDSYTPLKTSTGETFSVPSDTTYTLASMQITNGGSGTVTASAKIVSSTDVLLHHLFLDAEIGPGSTFGIRDEYVLHVGEKIQVKLSAAGVTVCGAAVEVS